MHMFESKTAMSPLIATVFLLAFAVALGVMIMNWSPSTEELLGPDYTVCENAQIQITKTPCFSTDVLNVGIKNMGNKKISAIMVISSYDGNPLSVTIKDSSMIATEQIERSVPFMYRGGDVDVEFIPLINDGEQLVQCKNQGIKISSLKYCS